MPYYLYGCAIIARIFWLFFYLYLHFYRMWSAARFNPSTPGFTLLFTSGVLATTGKLDLYAIITIGTIAAICGYIVGYATGARYGRRLLYEKNTEKYFTAAQGRAAERFMKRHGYSTLVVSRFLPIMHNVAPLLSGVAKTPYTPFMVANVFGGLLWVVTTTLLGYFLGKVIPNAQYYVIGIVILVAILSNTPYGKRLLQRFGNRIEEM